MTEREPVRLLLWYRGAPKYGTAIATRTLLKSLGPHVDATVAVTRVATATWLTAARPGTRSVVVPPIRSWRSVRAMLQFRAVVARVRPNVVHINSQDPGSSARYIVLVARSVRGVRTVLVQHMYGTPARTLSRVPMQVCARTVDAHVAVAEAVARRIEGDYGLPQDSIRTIANGVDAFGPAALSSAEAPPTFSGPVIGTIARLEAEKRVDALIDAIATISETTLVIVGNGRERPALEGQCRRLGIADRVFFVGHTETPEAYLRQFDVFVLPSARDAMPLVVLEAMANSIPVVATRVGGMAEVVHDGETGVLVAPDDVDALRAAIVRLLADPDERERLGAAGYARFQATFTAAAMAQAYERLYEELLTK